MASTAKVYWDLLRGVPVSDTGGTTNVPVPVLPYQALTPIRFEFVDVDPIEATTTAVDVSDVVSWRAAVANDWNPATEVMSRILDADIDDSDAENGIVVVDVDCGSSEFLSAVTGKEYITAYMDVYGYNAGAEEIISIRALPVRARMSLDPASGDPLDPAALYYTKTEIDALLTNYATLAGDNAFTGANTFTSASGIVTLQSATQDAMRVIGRAGGTGSHVLSLTPTTLTNSRTQTAQDLSGILTLQSAALTDTYIPVAGASGILANSTFRLSATTLTGPATTVISAATSITTTASTLSTYHTATGFGIGATPATYALEVTGVAKTTSDVRVGGRIRFTPSGTERGVTWADATAMYWEVGGTEVMRLLRSPAHLLIGTTTDTSLLSLKSGTTAADGIAFGADTTLYRSAAGVLTTGSVTLGAVSLGTSATKTLGVGTGTAPSSSPADMFQMYSADQAAGNACPHFRTEAGNIIKLYQQAEITDELTTVTFDAPGTPDYDLTSAVTDTSPFGLATADEFKTLLSVIANLQARVNELETVLVNTGLLADAD